MDLDIEGPEFRSLVQHLVEKGVALTSTMTVFETYTPGRPPASSGALDAMSVEARESYLRRRAQSAVNDESPWAELFYKAMRMDKAFVDAGGLLTVGTDPTGYGGVVAGYANQRAVMLLVEGGFTPEEAVEIATLNGARYLERDGEIGSIEVGKQADLIVVDGDVTEDITALRQAELVFKAGVGYDSRLLFDAVKGVVGIR
jgi:enamidase